MCEFSIVTAIFSNLMINMNKVYEHQRKSNASAEMDWLDLDDVTASH